LSVFGQFGEIVRQYAANAQSSATFAERSKSRRRAGAARGRTVAGREARLAGIALRANRARFVRVCCVAGRFAASIAPCGPILRGYASLKPGRGGS
jgi:hypothetical protein